MFLWAAAIPAIISAVSALYGSKKSGDAASKQNKLQNSIYGLQRDQYNENAPYRQYYSQTGMQANRQAYDYYNRLAHGDRYEIGAALAPEAQGIHDRNAQARNAAMTFGPRGGFTAAMGAQAYTGEAKDLNNLYSGARQNAMGQLAGMGGNFASLGSSLSGQGSAMLNSMGSTGMNMANIQQANALAQAQAGQAFGQSLYNIYNAYQNRGSNANTLPASHQLYGGGAPGVKGS